MSLACGLPVGSPRSPAPRSETRWSKKTSHPANCKRFPPRRGGKIRCFVIRACGASPGWTALLRPSEIRTQLRDRRVPSCPPVCFADAQENGVVLKGRGTRCQTRRFQVGPGPPSSSCSRRAGQSRRRGRRPSSAARGRWSGSAAASWGRGIRCGASTSRRTSCKRRSRPRCGRSRASRTTRRSTPGCARSSDTRSR
jgi:hypothetical protein